MRALPDCELGATHRSFGDRLLPHVVPVDCEKHGCWLPYGVGCSGMYMYVLIWYVYPWTVCCIISVNNLYVMVVVTLYIDALSWVNVCNHMHTHTTQHISKQTRTWPETNTKYTTPLYTNKHKQPHTTHTYTHMHNTQKATQPHTHTQLPVMVCKWPGGIVFSAFTSYEFIILVR